MSCNIVFLDVGQGDSMVAIPDEASDTAIVVDAPRARPMYEWLREQNVTTIDCIYYTHDHADHMPELAELPIFLTEWTKSGEVKRICLSMEAIILAADRIEAATANGEGNKANIKLLNDSLHRLLAWERGDSAFSTEFILAQRDSRVHVYDFISVEVLHPPLIYGALHMLGRAHRLNETSCVLMLRYGQFSVLCMADLEGEGLTEFLAFISHKEDGIVKTQILKLPHHGARQHIRDDYQTLLDQSDPDLAVLSVGSTNQHGHVVSEVFEMLWEHTLNPATSLQRFICTEATKTCVLSLLDRRSLGRKGLNAPVPCGGDIHIIAEHDGTWEQRNRLDHQERIKSLTYAACIGNFDMQLPLPLPIMEVKED